MPVKGVGVQVPPPTLKNPYGGKGSEADKLGFVITLSSPCSLGGALLISKISQGGWIPEQPTTRSGPGANVSARYIEGQPSTSDLLP